MQHQKMRRKALRLLLRHTDEAIDELRDDNDEMLRGGFIKIALSWSVANPLNVIFASSM